MKLDYQLNHSLELALLRNLYDVEEPVPCSKIVPLLLDIIEERYELVLRNEP